MYRFLFSGVISRIVPGAAVWLPGHIGVYIGDGLAVECTPKWRNKVQVTAVSNIGTKAGYNARKWTKWGKIPYISYEEEIENMSKEELKALIRETVKEVLDAENPVYKDLKDPYLLEASPLQPHKIPFMRLMQSKPNVSAEAAFIILTRSAAML